MKNRFVVIAIALIACGGEQTIQHVTLRPDEPQNDPEPTPPEEPTPEPETLVVPEVVPPDATYRVLALPENVSIPRLRTRRTTRHLESEDYMYGEVDVSWDNAAHSDPAVTAAIATWAHQNAMNQLQSAVTRVSCTLRLAHERALVAECHTRDDNSRDGPSPEVHVAAVKIEDGRLVPFAVTDGLVPRASLEALARQGCERQRRRLVDEGDPEEYYDCSARPTWAPANDGLHAHYPYIEVIDVRLPWHSVTEYVRADGPFAVFLPVAETHGLTVPGAEQLETSLAIACEVTYTIGNVSSLADAAHAAMELPVPENTTLLFESDTEEFSSGRLVLERCAHDVAEVRDLARDAATLAMRAHVRTERVTRHHSALLRWYWVTTALSVRDRPRDGAVQYTLPVGAIVMAHTGRINGENSGVGYQGTWANVSPTRATSGWSAGRYLRYSESPPIDPSTLLGSVPEAVRAEAVRNAFAGIRDGTGDAPEPFVVAQAPSEPGVYIALGNRVVHADGQLDEVLFVGAPHASHIFVGTRVEGAPSGMVHWQAFAPGSTSAGWSGDVPTAAGLPNNQHASVSTDVVRGHQRWLVEYRLPDRSFLRVRADGENLVEERARR